MRVGILTFHRTNNYGAVLQCFALQETLKSLGYDVKVVNYAQPYIEKNNSLFNFDFSAFFRSPRRTIRNFFHRLRVYYNFRWFRKNNLKLTSKCGFSNIPMHFDAYVIGSDQLWTAEHTGGRLDPVFTARFKTPSSKIFGYAISANEKSISQIEIKDLTNIVKNFDVLSFREKSIAAVISRNVNRLCRCDVDPTLLAPISCWNPLLNAKWNREKYIAVYQVRSFNGSAAIITKKARQLARLLGMSVVNLSNYKYSPADFVSVIRYSQCVITSSFHGTAFALLFKKPLWVFQLNDGHDGRCLDLLQSVGAEKCIVSLDDDLSVMPELDYEMVEHNIVNMKRDSLQYLESMKL